jgi:hypothetical protein
MCVYTSSEKSKNETHDQPAGACKWHENNICSCAFQTYTAFANDNDTTAMMTMMMMMMKEKEGMERFYV